ncbi:MAG: hypothetical protein IAF94_19275 [Pirellulaceae bacterium]|nr:hypothetical protein [Pirellulaceae bacterium]
MAEVAAAYGMTETTVRLACVQHNVDYPRLKRGPKSLVEERKALAEAVRNGRSVSNVAKAFGQPYRTVLIACREQHVKLIRKDVGAMRILAELIRGKHQSAVALELNISRQRVNQVALDASKSGVFAAVEATKARELRST